MSRSELVDVTLYRYHETDRAILVGEGIDHTKKVWLPLSQVEVSNLRADNKTGGDIVDVTMPRWLFEEKGFTSDA